MEGLKEALGIGLEPKDLTTLHVCLRALIIFCYTIFLVRIADKRFMSRKSAVDVVLGFIMASVMARTINGSAPFGPTLVGGLVLVLLHRVLVHLAVRSHFFGCLVKGSPDTVIEDGRVNQENLRKNDFSDHDFEEDLRLNGVASPEEVRLARIERNGELSVIKRQK